MNLLDAVLGLALVVWALVVLVTKRDHPIESVWGVVSLVYGLALVVVSIR